MPPQPPYRPKQLSLGPLEREILEILWEFEETTVKTIHERILSDPDRELAYSSVTTVLQRLMQKGWVTNRKAGKSFQWRPRLSRKDADAALAYDHLQRFLSVGNPDVVAAFAEQLDEKSVDQLQAIAARLQAARREKQDT